MGSYGHHEVKSYGHQDDHHDDHGYGHQSKGYGHHDDHHDDHHESKSYGHHEVQLDHKLNAVNDWGSYAHHGVKRDHHHAKSHYGDNGSHQILQRDQGLDKVNDRSEYAYDRVAPHSELKYDENHSELELHDLAVENTHIGHHQYKGHQNTKPAFNSNYTKNQRVNSVAEGYNAHTGFNPHGQNSAAHGPHAKPSYY